MAIGNLGKLITFKTSDKKILTFSNMQQNVSGRWSSHNRIMRKPLSEFNGSDLRSITFTIHLDAMLGVKPRKIFEKIEKAVEKGHVYPLVVGGKKVGKNKWKITKISEKWDVIYNGGELAKASLDLSLEEYL
jgi:phage protein U